MNNGTNYDQIKAEMGYWDVSEVGSQVVSPKIRPW